MIRNENIICISSIDWDFVWQGHQEIMSTFAKNGNRVLFIENTGIRTPTLRDIPRLKKRFVAWLKSIKGFREENKNLFIYSPVILPFPYSRMARWISRYMLLKPLRRWMKIMNFSEPIIWTFLPTGIALDIINSIDKKLLVYYCIADFYELVDNPKKVKNTEDALIKKCDIIFTQGELLAKKCQKYNNHVHIFPFGVNMETFENFKQNGRGTYQDIKSIKKPIVGYVGGIHRHIDFKLIKFIANAHPEWSIVLIGPTQVDASSLAGYNNIFLLGKKEFSELPSYINEFDVGIIPYQINNYTETVFPTKLNEYHALGKPVVSTDLPEVAKFNLKNNNLIFISRTFEEFVSHLSHALNSKNQELGKQRVLSARKNSWVTRVEEMSKLIEEALAEDSKEVIDWQDKFLKFYKIARKRAVYFACFASFIYLLVFYTPFVWFLAGPLKINQPPIKADCIVVFAGGVGESGKPGQGYEERVEQAVHLYKQGYADHMIFSSGYKYIFEEPLVMKAVAVSLGVPKDTIFLEDKAKNTYENVKFTKDILDKNKWNRVLLVSSPFHMRRVSLVFNKIAKDIKINCTPAEKNLFYRVEERDNFGRKVWKKIYFRQIKAIFHEYLSILYYWWKGWI